MPEKMVYVIEKWTVSPSVWCVKVEFHGGLILVGRAPVKEVYRSMHDGDVTVRLLGSDQRFGVCISDGYVGAHDGRIPSADQGHDIRGSALG